MNLDLSPMAKAFLLGMFIGGVYGVCFAVFQTHGKVAGIG